MEKYKSFSSIRKVDIEKFAGLANELITRMENPNTTPVSISCYGITFPTPDYYIKRFPTRGYILEHILSGKGYVIVNDKKYTVRAGDTYLLKPGQNCEYFSDKEDPYKKLWVNFSGTIFYDVIKSYKLQSTVYSGADLTDLFTRLYDTEKISIDNYEIYPEISEILFAMLMRLAKIVKGEKRVSQTARLIYNELFYSIDRPFSLDSLCEKLFLSKAEIIREFKKNYDVTPYRFLLAQKLRFAKSMLENDNASVKEISEFLAFSSPYHFSNCFKQHFGYSPLRYRKSILTNVNKDADE